MPPSLGDMLDQRLRLVLHQHVDAMNLGIDEVAENEIGDAVAAAVRARPAWTDPP